MTITENFYDPERPIYLRIGDWHSSETSKNYSSGDTEAGVSVYDLAPDGSIVVPEGEWSIKDLKLRLRSGAPRHLVQGSWVGAGGEGEPLLQGLTTIGLWPEDLPDGFRSSIIEFDDETLLMIDDALSETETSGLNTFKSLI